MGSGGRLREQLTLVKGTAKNTRSGKTAAELMAELNEDPESVARQVEPFFSYLLDDPTFLKTEEIYKPEHFGDALLIFQSSELAVRFVRDKGQVFVDIGGVRDGDDWHNLQNVLQFLKGDESHSIESAAWDLAEMGSELKANYDKVRELFKADNDTSIRTGLEVFEKRKSQEIIDRLMRSQ